VEAVLPGLVADLDPAEQVNVVGPVQERLGRGWPVGARTLVERALAQVDPAPGPRLEQLAARARGLLARTADAEVYFTKALSDPAGDTWPFERAQLRLDYGEWLRRQRRINDAKPVLATALETFRRLGAAPWASRAEAELRACVVTSAAATSTPAALADLTAQQREIVVLASRGLTNSEIADRLFLSPRTVASHLYRSYPKLGIAGRHQLRDLLDQATDHGTQRGLPSRLGLGTVRHMAYMKWPNLYLAGVADGRPAH
jgi:DNA-binding CsgD family transcriptional regulator